MRQTGSEEDEFEAPPEVGTERWWCLPTGEIRGPLDGILRLLQQEEITRGKAREMIGALFSDTWTPVPKAPWDKLNWAD